MRSCVDRVVPDEDNLLALAIQGDPTALTELLTPCLPRLHRTAAQLLSRPQDSQDAVQDALLSAFRHLSKFRGQAQFSTWMYTIVVNAANSILRKARRRPLTYSLDQPHPEHEELRFSDILCDSRCDLEYDYARLERSQLLAAILQKLPPSHRSIILLCDVEGLCMQDVAQRLGLSISAAKTRHLRATRFLLNAVKEARQRRVPILDILSRQPWAIPPDASDPVTEPDSCAGPISKIRFGVRPNGRVLSAAGVSSAKSARLDGRRAARLR